MGDRFTVLRSRSSRSQTAARIWCRLHPNHRIYGRESERVHPLAFRFADHRCADQQWFWFPLQLLRCAFAQVESLHRCNGLPFISMQRWAWNTQSIALHNPFAHHVRYKPHRLLQTECCMAIASAAFRGLQRCARSQYDGRDEVSVLQRNASSLCSRASTTAIVPAERMRVASANKESTPLPETWAASAPKEIARITNACGWPQLSTGQFAQASAPCAHSQSGFPACSSSFFYASSRGRDCISACASAVSGERMPRFSPPIDETGQLPQLFPLPLNSRMTFICSMGRCIACYGSARADSYSHRNRMTLFPDSASGLGPPEPSLSVRLPFLNRPLPRGAKPTPESPPKRSRNLSK